MAGILVRQGDTIMLEALVNKTQPLSLRLKLYQNAATPTLGSTERDFTEADFPGYRDVLLVPALWAADGGGAIRYPSQAFQLAANLQAAQLIYGWLLVQHGTGKLVTAERFTTPAGDPTAYPVQNLGDVLRVAPLIGPEED